MEPDAPADEEQDSIRRSRTKRNMFVVRVVVVVVVVVVALVVVA
jgi:t-SNARE complex subunit (syntaxin)